MRRDSIRDTHWSRLTYLINLGSLLKKSKIKFLSLSVLFLFPESSLAQNYVNSDMTCDNYSILETHLSCSSNDYIEGFAKPYCEIYLADNDEYSPSGQIILRDIRSCLQETLIHTPMLTCDNIGDIGISSHFDCYVKSGFCQMSEPDKFQVIWTARDLIFNIAVMAEFLKIEEFCESGCPRSAQPSRFYKTH